MNTNAAVPSVLDVVVMAAGKGTRMKSQLPKVLHAIAGRPLLQHVTDTAAAMQARRVVVITGHGAPQVEDACTQFVASADQGALLAVLHAPGQVARALPVRGFEDILQIDTIQRKGRVGCYTRSG